MYTRTQLDKAIDEIVVGENKAKRNREILKARLIDGETIEEIAEKQELSTTRTFLIIKKWQNQIYSYLNSGCS